MTSKTLQNVLGLLEGVKPNGKGYQALCPAHDDHNPSLSVAEGDDGRVLLKCFAGCSVEEIVAAVGLETRDLFERRGSERVGGSKPPASRELVDTGCTLEVYAAAKKLPSGFLKSIGAGEIANYNGHPA
ncbi:MAG: hypothetical protein M3P51_01850, partial [Chloroflexota bacterium]|nr:hypothetical protein [Chloroflexota bacterium]